MEVTRAIGKNLRGSHAHDQLGAGKLLEQRVVELDESRSIHAQAARLLEVDEQQRNRRVHEHVAKAAEHAVAVVTRKCDFIDVGHPHEPRRATLVRAVGPPWPSAVAAKKKVRLWMNARSSSANSVRDSFSTSRSARRRVSNRSCSLRMPA